MPSQIPCRRALATSFLGQTPYNIVIIMVVASIVAIVGDVVIVAVIIIVIVVIMVVMGKLVMVMEIT